MRNTTPSNILVPGRFLEVVAVFFQLGLTSFGSPVAQLRYFHEEFVRRRKRFDDHNYADLMALCQFLAGSASLKVSISHAGLWEYSPSGWVSRCPAPSSWSCSSRAGIGDISEAAVYSACAVGVGTAGKPRASRGEPIRRTPIGWAFLGGREIGWV